MSVDEVAPLLPQDGPVLSVVVPFFNEEQAVPALIAAVTASLDPLDVTYELILVDDGSTDGTWRRIREAAGRDNRLRGISLSRNFGLQNALFAGLTHALGQAVVTMDGDLQHPPEKIVEMLDAWRGGAKIVHANRSDSERSPRLKRATSSWFYRTFSTLTGIPIAEGSSDFRLIDRCVLASFKAIGDAELFLRGISYWVGFPSKTISYQADERRSGTTKLTFWKRFDLAMAAILSFSLTPLRLGIWLGLLTSLAACAGIVYILVRCFQGGTVPGWTSLLAVISLLFGVLFILIGILGAYIGQIYTILKNRPRFIINEKAGFR
ncbi:MAG: glycosyltransferase family 2 protein [Elusimicrobiota bacterium]